MIRIKVRFFGECQELTGCGEDEIDVSGEATVETALALIRSRYPALKQLEDRLFVAVNEDYATPAVPLSDGDRLAIFPPVSGGEDDFFHLTREPIDTTGLVRQLLQDRDGAVVSFEGVVRDHSMGKPVLYLEYHAYEPMALKMMRQIGREVHDNWPIDRLGMVHRLGRLEIGETSVAIVVTSGHRREAFEACRYAIDRLKRIVPIWKREYFEDGAVWAEGEGGSGDELPLDHIPGPAS